MIYLHHHLQLLMYVQIVLHLLHLTYNMIVLVYLNVFLLVHKQKILRDHTAKCNAVYLWRFSSIAFVKYFCTSSGYFLTASDISIYITPCDVSISFTLWYTSSESNCALTPARYFFSAYGIPKSFKCIFYTIWYIIPWCFFFCIWFYICNYIFHLKTI